jgi:uncharacterized RmlC-like cupin family protein
MSTHAPPPPLSPPLVKLTLPEFVDERGGLCSVTGHASVPFGIERVYWITGIPTTAYRGGHAHRSVSEMIVSVSGSFRVRWEGAHGEGEALLEAPNEAVVLPPLVWRHLDAFSPASACLVLASGPFDPAEYVDERDEFLRLLRAA